MKLIQKIMSTMVRSVSAKTRNGQNKSGTIQSSSLSSSGQNLDIDKYTGEILFV